MKRYLIPLLLFLAAAYPLSSLGADSLPTKPSSAASVVRAARIIFLGTKGGPTPSTLQSETSVLLIVDGKKYLIDAGAGTLHRILETGHYADEISDIFITHNHLDHNAGLESIMSTAWFDGNSNYGGVEWGHGRHMQIWGPADTKTVFDGAMEFLSVSARIFNDGELGNEKLVMPGDVFSEHSITRDGVFFDDGTVKVEAAANSHFHFIPGSPAAVAHDTSYSYRFDTPEGAIVFTGDTGPSAAVVKLARGADVLVSEVVDLDAMRRRAASRLSPSRLASLMEHMRNEHLTPEYIGKMAKEDHVKTVILYHFVPADGLSHQVVADVYLDTSIFAAGVKKYFPGTVIAARDLFEYDVFGNHQ